MSKENKILVVKKLRKAAKELGEVAQLIDPKSGEYLINTFNQNTLNLYPFKESLDDVVHSMKKYAQEIENEAKGNDLIDKIKENVEKGRIKYINVYLNEVIKNTERLILKDSIYNAINFLIQTKREDLLFEIIGWILNSEDYIEKIYQILMERDDLNQVRLLDREEMYTYISLSLRAVYEKKIRVSFNKLNGLNETIEIKSKKELIEFLHYLTRHSSALFIESEMNKTVALITYALLNTNELWETLEHGKYYLGQFLNKISEI